MLKTMSDACRMTGFEGQIALRRHPLLSAGPLFSGGWGDPSFQPREQA